MDDITYAILENAYKGESNRNELTSQVKDQFTPSEFETIEITIQGLFNANYIKTAPSFFGVNPDDKIILNDNYRQLFINEKLRIEKEFARQELSDKKSHIDFRNAQKVAKTYWLTFGMAVFALLISLVLLILKLIGL